MLPFIIAGLTTGSVYGLAGLGLVLTYKTSGVFNFAHGAIATIAAFLFYTLSSLEGMPWQLAGLICIFVAGPILGFGFERIARSLSRAPLVEKVLATVGVLLIVQSGIILIYGESQNRTVPQFLPSKSFDLAGTPVSASDLIIVVFGLLATIGLYAYFRSARTGVAMRAVVGNPELLDLAGTSPNTVRRYAWVIGVCFASVSGILLAPLISLDGTTLTLLVIQAFGAAAIGRFTSLPMTYAGGLVIGVAASLATKYFTKGLLASLPAALPFVILFLILLVSRRDRHAAPSVLRPPRQATWLAPWPIQLGGGVGVFLALVLVPDIVGFHLTDWTLFLTSTIAFLALGLLVRTSGQVSLAHVSFMAIGAVAFSHCTENLQMPWGVALIIAGLAAVPIGALLSIPAIRLSGLYLALATLGFGVLLAYMFYTEPYMFGSDGLGLTEPRPSLGGINLSSDRGFYYLVLALTAVSTLSLVGLNRSRLGRLLRALADSPRGLATSGTSINVTRVLVFCLSAFLAAISGALGGVAQGVVSGDSYPPLLSLTYFALVVIQPGRAPWYALLGAAGLSLIPSYLPSSNTSNYLGLVFGAFAVFYAVMPEDKRGGFPPSLSRLIDSFARRERRSKPEPGPTQGPRTVRPSKFVSAHLEVTDLRVQYGGVVAVDGVNLIVSSGVITGLIGPNGAGKTSTFDAISGLTAPTSGSVVLDGRDLSRLGPAARARRGLGRTFQQMELFNSLTVAQNIELGKEASFAGNNLLGHLRSGGRCREEVRLAAADAMSLCGLTGLKDQPVGALSTGQRRLVELARCLAGPARLLLLDEPSSGLDRAETAKFGRLLQTVVRERQLGILLVEHDMALVTQVCNRIHLLDFGKQVFEGTPAALVKSPIVHAAYLGDTEVEDTMTEDALVPSASTQAEHTQ